MLDDMYYDSLVKVKRISHSPSSEKTSFFTATKFPSLEDKESPSDCKSITQSGCSPLLHACVFPAETNGDRPEPGFTALATPHLSAWLSFPKPLHVIQVLLLIYLNSGVSFSSFDFEIEADPD